MGKNLIFIGAPGSGKGTQSAKFSAGNNYDHISTGDLLRNEIAKGTQLGTRVKSVMDAGQLVSDELVEELLKANLQLDTKSYIFDGYPRNIEQAKKLDSILGKYLYLSVYFKLDTELLVDRLANRRVTKDGKHIYNLKTNPPKIEGVCDVTGQELIQRADDKEEIVRNRMLVFEQTIGPVVKYYENKKNLIVVNAEASIDSIYEQIIAKIN